MSAEHVEQWELRSRFARALSEMYGREVSAYTTLEVAADVNSDVARRLGADAERLGSIARVTAERHGAIRLGTPAELAEAAKVSAAMGMHPDGGLSTEQASRFLALATASFEMPDEPVDGPWHRELARISSVAADILLLRQTSFRALAEPRPFRGADGHVETVALRVRVGEVESRGIALTAAGRDLHDKLTDELGSVAAADRAGRGALLWDQHFPRTEGELARSGLAFFTYDVNMEPARNRNLPPVTTEELIAGGWITPQPNVYEDFLPRSAAGIFQSNLAGDGAHDADEQHAVLEMDWMAGVLDREIADPIALYAEQQERSLGDARAALGMGVGAA